MSFSYNAADTQPSSGGHSDPVPAGAYRLRVSDAKQGKSKNGDYQVVVTFRVVGGQYDKRRIPFHRVTFFEADAPGAGIALAFLKAIGQPYKGKFDVDSDAWLGKEILADVEQEEYQGKINNRVQNIEAPPAEDGAAPKEEEETEIPF